MNIEQKEQLEQLLAGRRLTMFENEYLLLLSEIKDELRRLGNVKIYCEFCEKFQCIIWIGFPQIEPIHRYIIRTGDLLELDRFGKVIGKITATEQIQSAIEAAGSPGVFWDSSWISLSVGDQWVPPTT